MIHEPSSSQHKRSDKYNDLMAMDSIALNLADPEDNAKLDFILDKEEEDEVLGKALSAKVLMYFYKAYPDTDRRTLREQLLNIETWFSNLIDTSHRKNEEFLFQTKFESLNQLLKNFSQAENKFLKEELDSLKSEYAKSRRHYFDLLKTFLSYDEQVHQLFTIAKKKNYEREAFKAKSIIDFQVKMFLRKLNNINTKK